MKLAAVDQSANYLWYTALQQQQDIYIPQSLEQAYKHEPKKPTDWPITFNWKHNRVVDARK